MRELVQYVSCVCTPDEFAEVLASKSHPEIYINNGTGLLKHVGLSGNRHVRIKVEKLPVGSSINQQVEVNEDINFLPAGKIPYIFFEQIVEFFRQVSKKMKSEFEAHAWVLWSAERGYFISIPEQNVSKASVSFTYNDDSLPPGSIIVLDIHSHNTMGAFYSGTDNNNDKSGIYYSAVIGKLTNTTFEYVIRFNLYEQKKTCTLEEVFLIEDKVVDVPVSWLDKVNNFTVPNTKPGIPRGTRHRSMWDQRDGSTQDPFGYAEYRGYTEHSPEFLKQAAEQSKGSGETRDSSKKGPVQDGIKEENGKLNEYVPGPLDEDPMAWFLDDDMALTDDLHHTNDSDDSDDLEDLEGYGVLYGPEALEAWKVVEDFMRNFEECDEILFELIRESYSMLTSEGQMKIAQEGMR